jgi:parvulin-like peptidyl-prolyl isomerase
MSKKQIAAIFFGVIVLGAIVVAAATGGIGKDSVPKDAVAKVKDKTISVDDFNRALERAKLQQSITETPAVGTDEYNQLRDAAMGQLLDSAWIEGEAADKGVEATDKEIADTLAQEKQQQGIKTEKDFQDALKQAGLTLDELNAQIKLQVLSDKLQSKIEENVPTVTDSEAQDFYDQNKAQFEQPASRDIRVILNKDPDKIDEAKKKLEADSSDAEWKKVAADDSTDAATKDSGGVRAGVTQGTLEPELDSAVFAAPLNTIEGPVTTSQGTYIFEVTKDTPKTTQPFDQVSQQLIQQLQSQNQQKVFNAFILDYRAKWTDVTICADGYIVDQCDNFEGPSTPQQDCTADVAKQTGCPPPVTGRSPIKPGCSDPFLETAGSPQFPHPAGEDPAADPATATAGAKPDPCQPAAAAAGAAGGSVPVTPSG